MDRDLEAILAITATADGCDREFKELWARLLATQPRPAPVIIGPITPATGTTDRGTLSTASTPAEATTGQRVPKVDTRIQ